MAVVWDAGMLSLLLHQTARFPAAPGTKTPITFPRERIELLLSVLAKQKETILIPAPALTEFLYVVEDAGPGYIQTIDKKSSFEVAPYDEKAAVEAALMMQQFRKEDGKASGPGDGNWQKVKVDQQIVAIAKAEGVDCLYTADRGMFAMAKRVNVPVVALWELPAPESNTPLLDLPEEDEATGLAADESGNFPTPAAVGAPGDPPESSGALAKSEGPPPQAAESTQSES